MKFLITTAMFLASATAAISQTKNVKTETVKIYGNCGRCEATIEKAGNVKNVAKVDWNKDTKMATLEYDESKTNRDEILKRIALAGYDSDEFLAPDNVYAQLPGCCKYERVNKTAAAKGDHTDHSQHTMAEPATKSSHANHGQQAMAEPAQSTAEGHSGHYHHAMTADNNKKSATEASRLQALFNHYFSLKDALVKTDAAMASSAAAQLLATAKAVKANELTATEQPVWAKVLNGLTSDAQKISTSKDVSKQRTIFSSLTEHVYALVKVAGQSSPTYYQRCPMFNDGKGANWLSQERTIQNPYYGAQMLSCGSVQETIGGQ
ncbi:MAG: DUF3347 domain-containing protein [Agriterribacter sp.]